MGVSQATEPHLEDKSGNGAENERESERERKRVPARPATAFLVRLHFAVAFFVSQAKLHVSATDQSAARIHEYGTEYASSHLMAGVSK